MTGVLWTTPWMPRPREASTSTFPWASGRMHPIGSMARESRAWCAETRRSTLGLLTPFIRRRSTRLSWRGWSPPSVSASAAILRRSRRVSRSSRSRPGARATNAPIRATLSRRSTICRRNPPRGGSSGYGSSVCSRRPFRVCLTSLGSPSCSIT